MEVTLQLLRQSDIAWLLGVTRQRAAEVVRKADFPKPYAYTGDVPLWAPDEFENWLESWQRKPGRPKKEKP